MADNARTQARASDTIAPVGVRGVEGRAKPRLRLPVGAVDCHMHIYDARVPFCAGAGLPHADASIVEYRDLQARLGLSRAVVVTPSAYGANNAVTLEAIAALGDCARGVAIVDQAVSERELDVLHAGGIRGARFNFNLSPMPTIDALKALAPRLAERGWHVQIGMRAPRLLTEAATLRALPGILVLEHCAGISAAADDRCGPAWQLVQELLDTGRCWVKLSGPYLRDPSGSPAYPLLRPYIHDLVARAPTRLVWGSDWPHPTERHKPDDAALVDLMMDWAPSESDRNRIFVANPASLYDFPPFHPNSAPKGPEPCCCHAERQS